MSTKTQWKILAGILAFFLLVNVLDWLHISLGLVVLSILIVVLAYILILPKSLILFLCNFAYAPGTDEKKRESWDRGWRIVLFEVIQTIHDWFWGFVTRYYPFSLLYSDRLFHAGNQDVKAFINELEVYAKEIHLPFLIQSGDTSAPMMMFHVVQRGYRLKKAAYLEQLKEKLQSKYESIYLQDKVDGFTILVPTSMLRGQSIPDQVETLHKAAHKAYVWLMETRVVLKIFTKKFFLCG